MLVLAGAVIVGLVVVVRRPVVEPFDVLVAISAVVSIVALQASLFTLQAELVVEPVVVVSLAALAEVCQWVGFPEHGRVARVASELIGTAHARIVARKALGVDQIVEEVLIAEA